MTSSPLWKGEDSSRDRGYWPHPWGLAVLAGYAVVFTVAAARFFRWD